MKTNFSGSVWSLGSTCSFSTLYNKGRKKVGHELKDILAECWFNGVECYETDLLGHVKSLMIMLITVTMAIDSNGS